MASEQFDAVIVGGGIVGAVQALLLARHGASVLLIEAAAESATATSQQPETQQPEMEQRSVALSHRSYELLAADGLWLADAACPINEIQVTDKGSFGSARITARDLNTAALGYVVANHRFEQHLRQLVRSQKSIKFLQPATATLLHNSDSGAELKVSQPDGERDAPPAGSLNGETGAQASTAARSNVNTASSGHKEALKDFTVRCRLLIAADGTHSQIRQSLGLKLNQHDYDQVAVVANVECQLDHQHIAHERFTESGPLALLPLSRRCMAMVYTARASDAEVLKAMPEADFLQLLQSRFGGKLGRFRTLGRRAVFPLALSESESQTYGSCVLIGNSARTLHPVAGQGLNLALRDVYALMASIGSQFGSGLLPDSGQPPAAEHHNGDLSPILDDFARQRRQDQRATVRRTDLLARFFSGNTLLAAPASLRGAGLVLLDGLAPLRKRFAADSAGVGVPLGRHQESLSKNQ